MDEYLLSEGGVERAWIEQALDGVGDVGRYLDCVDLGRVRRQLAT